MLRATGPTKPLADARADNVRNAVRRDETLPHHPCNLHYLDVIASIIFSKARIVPTDRADEDSNRSTRDPLGFRVDFLNTENALLWKRGSAPSKLLRDLKAASIAAIQIDEAAFREGLPLHASNVPGYPEWAARAFDVSASGLRSSVRQAPQARHRSAIVNRQGTVASRTRSPFRSAARG